MATTPASTYFHTERACRFECCRTFIKFAFNELHRTDYATTRTLPSSRTPRITSIHADSRQCTICETHLMTRKGLLYEKLSMGSHPNNAKRKVVPRDCEIRFGNIHGYRLSLFRRTLLVVGRISFGLRYCYLHKLRTKRLASCFNAIYFASARCLTKLHQPQDVMMLFPNHHNYTSFLSLIFRVGVCRHLTYPIVYIPYIPWHSPLHNILPPWPAIYLPRRRVPVFDIIPNISLVFLGTCHCKPPFCPPGPRRPRGLSRPPSISLHSDARGNNARTPNDIATMPLRTVQITNKRTTAPGRNTSGTSDTKTSIGFHQPHFTSGNQEQVASLERCQHTHRNSDTRRNNTTNPSLWAHPGQISAVHPRKHQQRHQGGRAKCL